MTRRRRPPAPPAAPAPPAQSQEPGLAPVAVMQVGAQQELLINAGALQGAIFNSSRISIIATDHKGTIQIFNAGAELMFGYSADEMLNKVMPADLYDLEDVSARGQALSQEFGTPISSSFEALAYRAARGVEDTYELKKIRKDGTRFPGAVTVTTLRDKAGAIIGYLMIGTDNTERKMAEEQRHLIEESFRLMVESVSDCAIVQLDPDGLIQSWNAGAERIKGYSSKEIIGQNFSLFYPAADVTAGKPQRDLASTASLGRLDEEGWGLRKDGSTFWAQSLLTAIRDAAGTLRGFARLTRDLTARRQVEHDLSQARDEALQASRVKSEFLANMSHEIRTPMNGVIGMTEVLQDTPLSQTQRYAVETIRFSGQSLLKIINDILDFSKIEAGMLRMETIDLDLHDVMQRAIGIFNEPVADKGLALTLQVDDAVPTLLRGDPGRLYQVLTNLVGNAVKFTDHGTVDVHVALERQSAADALIRFTVRDSGPGISPEVQRRLFQPFMQADGSTTRKFGGSGLGLAIARQLAAMMGGEMGVESAPGRGSTFWFTARLELGAARTEQAPAPAVAAAGPAGSRNTRIRRALVAEDNAVNQRVAREQLRALGLAADVVSNGRKAVEALQRKRYDVVLMDCQMPVLDGYAATAAIRAAEAPGQRTWIIAMTAHAMGGDREKCLAAGMDDYLAKPVVKRDLREALERFEAQADAPPSQDSPVDLSVLREAANGDEAFARELADLFRSQLREQLGLLRTAVAERSASTVHDIAHHCQGSSHTCGAEGLASLFNELVHLGHDGQLEQAPRVAAEIEREFARVQQVLRALSSPAGPSP